MSEKKKVNLAEAMKQRLVQQTSRVQERQDQGLVKKTQPLKNQLSKKPNNQRKRTGI
jgi:hypothetical protein